ncbi:hypothetical protein [Dyella tabacisoli]|uniref:Uncharacterized protein n=1 Tax=Dyella tabacisoli TaxID=2282381 RepID=A0A369UP73_9GAMM|nr:hypothetical protein [Dyella tabacisoli]RDD81518.1 hypothetical protein DVJ77_10065 [Dyella tabacisoli]
MDEKNIDAARERRRLRAAMEGMGRKRSLAVSGFVVALGCLMCAEIYTQFPNAVRWSMRLAGVLVFLPLALPFLRSACPQCKGRYHSVASIFRHPDHALPCKSCGFSIDKHISMY